MRLKLHSPTGVIVMTAAGVVLALGSLLLLQNSRNGWPFSQRATTQEQARESARAVTTGHVSRAPTRATVGADAAGLEALGVQFAPVVMEVIGRPVRAVATVVADEARISHVHTRVSGWLERLFVNTTGQPVRAGEPLAAVYSQELFASQTEYLSLFRLEQDAPRTAALDAAHTRLELLGITAGEIAEIERTGHARRLVTLVAPHNGVVLHLGVSAGTAVDPSTEIVTVADLSTVWVLAEVAQSDAAGLAQGAVATLDFPALGRAPFTARVALVYPTLTDRTRTVRMRFAVANRDGVLRPGLYGTAEFAAKRREALTVPRDAIVDTGESQYSYVRTAAGTIEPREVKVGARLGERVEVTEGLSPGELVVASGVFLIDSESRMRASGTGAGHSGHGAGATREPPPPRDQEQTIAPPPGHQDGHGR